LLVEWGRDAGRDALVLGGGKSGCAEIMWAVACASLVGTLHPVTFTHEFHKMKQKA
jgi:hypothetical protein